MKDNKVVMLGLHFGHDAGVSILINGIPKCNLIRERYNRSKHSFGVNVDHIEEALLDAKVKKIYLMTTNCKNFYLKMGFYPEKNQSLMTINKEQNLI